MKDFLTWSEEDIKAVRNWLREESKKVDAETLEELSDLEHVQWEEWSKTISGDLKKYVEILSKCDDMYPVQEVIRLINDRISRWEKFWVPYNELEDEIQEYDRIWARKAMAIMNGETLDNSEK